MKLSLIDEPFDIDSFEIDGTPKRIIVAATSGGSDSPFLLTAEQIELLDNEDHVYLYQIVEYNSDLQNGKLVIRKGNPKKYADLEGRIFELQVK